MRKAWLALVFCFLVVASAEASRPFLDLDFDAPECTASWWDLGWQYPFDEIIDTTTVYSGNQSLQVKYLGNVAWRPQFGSGGWIQEIPASAVSAFAGKTIRLSGAIRTEGVAQGYAGIWWVALNQDGSYSYGDMYETGPGGNTPWTRYAVEGQISPQAQSIFFGTELAGSGTAWFDGLEIALDGHVWKDGDQKLREPSPGATDWLRQRAIPFATPVAGNGFADLQALKPVIGDARIVSLGEATHGTREFFQMKHRLLELLVSEMGFTHFSIEANMPEAYRLNDYVLHGIGDPKLLLRGMYFWTWNTQEVLDMIEWMRQYNASGRGPVQFTGFDMQFAAVGIQNVRAFLETAEPEYLPTAQLYLSRIAAADANGVVAAQDLAAARELFAHLSAGRSGYLGRFTAWEVDWAIQNARILIQCLESLAGIRSRDESMAENVGWILDHSPANSKIVLWAHNGHVNRVPGWMGDYLGQRHGDDMYVLGFAYRDGSYNAVSRRGLVPHATLPPPPGSVETLLDSAGLPRFILDLRSIEGDDEAPGAWLKKPQNLRSIGAVESRCAHYPSTVSKEYDGLIWIESTNPSQLLPFR